VPSATRVIGWLYPDGRPHVDDLGTDTKNISMTTPPHGFADLLAGLKWRNGEANGAGQGQIDVRVLTHPDGSHSYIVDVPGTKDWHENPFEPHDNKLNDLSTNLHAMSGQSTAYEQGILDALRRVHADADDPVMLVGHSQGGIVAAQTALDLANSSEPEFNVTHVVTAGSPIGRMNVPDSVQVLSLENSNDVVPHFDGTANPDRANWVTVGFDNQLGIIGDNHGLEQSYAPAAGQLDSSTDPSVASYRQSAGAFITGKDGTDMTSHVYQITRS
jgi:pimeloyl-ACP methyl ester carboxylesterase